MNSICKKFKKVISSVVLSCSMVCSGGFANAGLNGKGISEADLGKIERLGEKWFDELKEKAKKYRRDRIPSNTFCFIDDDWVAAVYSIVSENDNTAAGHIKRFIDNEISLENLIDTGSELAKKGKICNFSLSCWMVRYLEERGIKCALTSVKKSFSGSELDNIACFDRNWSNFGVIVFYEDNNEARIYIPDIMMTRNSASFKNMCCKIDMSEHFCVFLGENDLKMLGLEGRKGRDFDLVTARSYGDALCIMPYCVNITANYFKPIDNKLFNQLIPTSEKKLISKEQGFFDNFFGNK